MSRGGSRNLVLTGFMGTGKTGAGRIVAERLGRRFVDTDQMIEERTGRSIGELFEQGEASFRQLEAEMCRALALERGLVIATGGWTLGPETNRAVLGESALIVCLSAPAGELIRRLEGQDTRPLLSGDNWTVRLEMLLARRRPGYRRIALQVETGGLTLEQTAGRVLRLWQAFGESGPPLAVPISVPAPGYQVLVGRGLLDHLGALVDAALPKVSGTAVVTDEHVGPLYGQRAAERLGASSYVEIEAGEEHKTLETVRALYDRFLAARLDRTGAILALGGGVVGDVAGFAAATYLRGLSLVQVPTTLLSMVDSSVGGKTGVDLPQGKNLVGAFKQPALVVADPDVLRTLPDEELRSGLGEVVKHGMIGDAELFEALEAGGLEDWKAGRSEASNLPAFQSSGAAPLAEWIARAVAVKRDVVEEDPFEEGRRAVLNLGHTYGHALEFCSGYRLRHGEAVAVGLVAAARTAARLGVCDRALPERVAGVVRRLGLPTGYRDSTPQEVLAAMGADKKRAGRRLRFVLPQALGRVIVTDDVPEALVLEVLAGLRESA
jgi:3-dehydroquinate synthase